MTDDCDHCFCLAVTGLNSTQCKRYVLKCCMCGEKRSVHKVAEQLRSAARLRIATGPQ